MAGLLKTSVVVLVLITVAKRFIAADKATAKEAPTTSALQETSQEPDETTGRDGQFTGRYPVELCNLFYEFWTNHRLVWTTRTSSLCDRCKRQQLVHLNETGVMLQTMWNNPNNGHLISQDRYWEFRPNGSIAHYYKDSTGTDRLIVEEHLVYVNDNKTCGVVERGEWYYWPVQDKPDYDRSCKESWCGCKHDEKNGRLVCLNRPVHDVIVNDTQKDNMPVECKDKYDEKRKEVQREDDEVVYEEDCINGPQQKHCSRSG